MPDSQDTPNTAVLTTENTLEPFRIIYRTTDAVEFLENNQIASQDNINKMTPMGANLIHNGATFRLWAPRAKEVYIITGKTEINDIRNGTNHYKKAKKLVRRDDDLANGHWAGFIEGVKDGDHYQFYIVGDATKGLKRDAYARELSKNPAYPSCNCIVRDANSYQWQEDTDYKTHHYNDMIIYQLHVGTFLGSEAPNKANKFLDVLYKLEYLFELGINTIQLMPIIEFASPRSKGYEGSDVFSPEMDYQVDSNKIDNYLNIINSLLQKKGKNPITRDVLEIPINQLKVLVDICHIYDIAVLFDLVYNHIGGQIPGQDESIWMYDRFDYIGGKPENSLYFTNQSHAGGYCFALWQQEVRQFLIDNTVFFINEYHVDGFRYDQVSVIRKTSQNNAWQFCQNITDSVRHIKPSSIQIAENWGVDTWITKNKNDGGAGFDSCWTDGLRISIRRELSNAAQGRDTYVSMKSIRDNLYPPNFSSAWNTVQYIESHDEVKVKEEYGNRIYLPRIAKIAGGNDSRSWYARSRARVASGILLTAPGIPMLFMGQEILEDKSWSDNPNYFQNTLIWWSGLKYDRHMRDFLSFMKDITWLRRKHPALRTSEFGEINGYHADDFNRIMAYQRYIKNVGRDVVVVVSLNEWTFSNDNKYRLGFPRAGRWYEVFNSAAYDEMQDGNLNPHCDGNGGHIYVEGSPMHKMPYSAEIVIPSNSILVFALDKGDF